MGFRVVYIEESEYLRLYLDNLKVETSRGDIIIPLADIHTLIIDNYKTSLTVRLMNALSKYNITTILCDIDHLPCSYILALNSHYSSSGNIMKQIKWSENIKAQLHREIIKTKILNQCQILSKHKSNQEVIKTLLSYINEVELNDKTNREALAAKIYFRELFGNDFIRFSETTINAGLDYGYSILRSVISTILVSKGYLPNLGIFHRGSENPFNLSDDVIEVFRPIVDDYVYTKIKDFPSFTEKHRQDLTQLSVKRIYIDTSNQTIRNAIIIYFESILKCIEENNVNFFLRPDCIIRDDI